MYYIVDHKKLWYAKEILDIKVETLEELKYIRVSHVKNQYKKMLKKYNIKDENNKFHFEMFRDLLIFYVKYYKK